MEANQHLAIWTVIANPADYPGLFVARKWLMVEGREVPTNEVVVGLTLQAVREQIPIGLQWMPRSPDDDPVIVETWF
jgi:hypothetical protein